MRTTLVTILRAALAASVLLLVGACAGAGYAARGAERVTPDGAERVSYVIAGESLPAERMLADVVSARWPRLVRGDLPRGGAGQAESPDRFGVYDARGAFLGGPDYLLVLRAGDVREIRRLTANEEFARYGRRHPAGAVVLDWRRVAR